MDAASVFAPATLIPAIVAISFAAGLNVYATMLALGGMARLHWIALPPGLELLTANWVLGASAVLFAGGFVVDKIPGFDLLWNAAHTAIRIPLATLMAYAAASQLSPGRQLAIACVAAVVSAAAHGTKTAAHLTVTPSPEPLSNAGVSSASDALAIGLSWLAFHHPVAAAVSAGLLLVVGLTGCVLLWRLVRAGVRRLAEKRQKFPVTPGAV